MIREEQIPWLKEFLSRVCESTEDRQEIEGIIDTFRKLWHVVKAAEANTYPRSPRLEEALKGVKRTSV